VPFAFGTGNSSLPAGTYQVELLTQSRPGWDTLEVVVFRGTGVPFSVSMVARVEAGSGRASHLTVPAAGRTDDFVANENERARFELAGPETKSPAALRSATNSDVTLAVDGSDRERPSAPTVGREKQAASSSRVRARRPIPEEKLTGRRDFCAADGLRRERPGNEVRVSSERRPGHAPRCGYSRLAVS
jgi:hypothetical protein